MPKYENLADAPFEVRKRYFQIKYVKYFMGITRLYSRITLTTKERNKNRVLSKTLRTYRIETERARREGNECTQVLMNIGLYYLIAEKDIQTVKIDALTHHDKWKRLLSLRIILLTIHEWDMGKASNKNLKDLLVKSSVEVNLQNELFQALRLLRKSQEKAAKILHFERNATIAHRDPDALLQLNTIENLNPKKVFSAMEEFYKSSAIFLSVLPKVMLQAGSMQGLFSFMLKTSNLKKK